MCPEMKSWYLFLLFWKGQSCGCSWKLDPEQAAGIGSAWAPVTDHRGSNPRVSI